MAKSKNNDNTDTNLEDLDLSLDSLELEAIETEINKDSEEEYEYVEVEDGEEISDDEEYEYIEVEEDEEEVQKQENTNQTAENIENTTEETPIEITETEKETTENTEELSSNEKNISTDEELILENIEENNSEEDLSLDDFNFDTINEDIQNKDKDFKDLEIEENKSITEEISSNDDNSITNETSEVEENPSPATREIAEEITKENAESENVHIEEMPEASLANSKSETILKDFKEISSENLVIKTLTDKSFNKIYKKAQIFNNNFGQITYSGKEKSSSIVLDEIDFEDLYLWNIIIFRRNEIAINKKDKEIEISKEDKNAIRIANLYGPDGKAQKFYDVEKINLAQKDKKIPIQKLEAGNFFLKEIKGDWGISVTDFTIVGLTDKYGKSIEIPQNCDGLIVGPNKSVMYFDNIKEIIVAKSAEDRDSEKDIQKWLSGNTNDNIYRFDANSNSDEFIGSDENNIIHINAGYSTYGWNVVFENGIRMSLADVKEYQSRHGKLPTNAGMVIRGAKTLTFSNVEKILVYKPVQYFGYGFGNPVS
jgi:chemotaxis protein histidine kinase CheA